MVGSTYQALDEINPRTYIGSGKVAEVAAAMAARGADLLVFDDELSPGGWVGWVGGVGAWGWGLWVGGVGRVGGGVGGWSCRGLAAADVHGLLPLGTAEGVEWGTQPPRTRPRTLSHPPPHRAHPAFPPPPRTGQLRNLERALGGSVRLCDRTALILDIFSQRAATREGKLQVRAGLL